MQTDNSIKNKITAYLPKAVFIICLIQPLLDILSYWVDYFKITNIITLGLRMLLLTFIVALAFTISTRKRVYFITAGILCLFTLCHIFVHFKIGYIDLTADITNLIRIYHLPLVTLCFITFFKANKDIYKYILAGFAAAFIVIIIIDILSLITNTDPHTYRDKNIGLCGWFYFANTQSSIISALISIFTLCVIKK